MKKNEFLSSKFDDQSRMRNFIKHSKEFNKKNLKTTGAAAGLYALIMFVLHFVV